MILCSCVMFTTLRLFDGMHLKKEEHILHRFSNDFSSANMFANNF